MSSPLQFYAQPTQQRRSIENQPYGGIDKIELPNLRPAEDHSGPDRSYWLEMPIGRGQWVTGWVANADKGWLECLILTINTLARPNWHRSERVFGLALAYGLAISTGAPRPAVDLCATLLSPFLYHGSYDITAGFKNLTNIEIGRMMINQQTQRRLSMFEVMDFLRVSPYRPEQVQRTPEYMGEALHRFLGHTP